MSHEAAHVKQALRDWIVQHAHRPLDGIRDDTLILEERVITSLQVMELILFIERTAARRINLPQLKPSSFRSIDSIYETFFAGEGRDHAAV